MKLRTRAMVLSIVFSAAALISQAQAPIAGQPQPLNQLQAPDIAQSLNALADQPPTHTGFTFDRSMLQIARGYLESEGMDDRRAAAALSSISYDNYRYAQPAVYNHDTMATIAASYRAAGWQHLVDAHEVRTNSTDHHTHLTDLWLHMSGADVDGIMVITRGVRNVNVVQVACDLRPLDLLHLSGHFGIPKVDPSALMVPDPANR